MEYLKLTNTVDSGRHFLPTLDGWRALAVGSVVVGHWALRAPGQQGFAWLAASLASQGVNLFFAISGYLITTRLLLEFDEAGSISLPRFYIRRAFRILPPAMLYLLTVAVLAAAGTIAVGRSDIASAAFFSANYWMPRSWYVSHFWSLSMEEHFYVFWPVVLVWCGARRAAGIAMGLIAFTIIWRQVALMVMHDGQNLLQRTDLRLDAFLFPALLAILLRLPEWRERLVRAGLPSLLALAAVYLGIHFYPDWENLKTLLVSMLLPLIVIATVHNPNSYAGQFLEWRPLAWLGRISYSVYLWHKLLQIPSHNFGVHLVLVVLGAAAGYYIIEKPLMRAGRYFARKTANSGVPANGVLSTR
jgi:peptidoglycan/LPS O-acetylase OafA/YrhL